MPHKYPEDVEEWARELAHSLAPFAAEREDPVVPSKWDIPETQWITWGGEGTLDGTGGSKDKPFIEPARIELSTPRTIHVTLSVDGTPGQSVEFQINQGLGRVDLVRLVSIAVPGLVDLVLPARILRVEAREDPASPAGAPIKVQVVCAPNYPDFDMRRASVLR